MGNKSASVLAKLKNLSRNKGLSLQQLLNLFCQEEFLRRLELSKYNDNLILKGGYLLYSMSGFTTRPTMDADYLLMNHPNNIEEIDRLVQDVINIDTSNTFIQIQVRSIERISEIKEYHGVRVNLIGIIGKTKTPFSIDFGVGDVIFPESVKRTLPTLLDGFHKPELLTYSLESTISEKVDAIVTHMEATSRMKDFYDIYNLAISFDFEGSELQNALKSTFENRGTPIERDSILVISRLSNDPVVVKRWMIFCKKVLGFELDLSMVIEVIVCIINKPFEAFYDKAKFIGYWNSKIQSYTDSN